MSGGVFSGISSGILGIEMPLSQSHQQKQNHENPHQLHAHSQHPQMNVNFPHQQDVDQPIKQHYPYAPKTRHQHSPLSDDDEPGVSPEDGNGDTKRTTSPWQRMKWTDNMVRLLIAAVYYIGDEVGPEGSDPPGKKKIGGLLQKKGKWKSVSRAMMQKGFYVSPQQCEDKFNDLNKRYKRVNDILGKGTACKVVENPNLLDTMDHISPKMKEEVRKLLSSKHLFFREMCAYHNSCGGGATALSHSPEVSAETSHHFRQHAQQPCLHSSEKITLERVVKVGSEDEDEDEDDEEEEEDEDYVMENGFRGQTEPGNEEDDVEDRQNLMKRPRRELQMGFSSFIHEFRCELMRLSQDGARSPLDKRQWMKTRLMQLEGKRVEYLYESFELEKQRLKWLKYSVKKEREMELSRLKNEKRKLENERMILLVKEKEMELNYLYQQQQSSNKMGEQPSPAV